MREWEGNDLGHHERKIEI